MYKWKALKPLWEYTHTHTPVFLITNLQKLVKAFVVRINLGRNLSCNIVLWFRFLFACIMMTQELLLKCASMRKRNMNIRKLRSRRRFSLAYVHIVDTHYRGLMWESMYARTCFLILYFFCLITLCIYWKR